MRHSEKLSQGVNEEQAKEDLAKQMIRLKKVEQKGKEEEQFQEFAKDTNNRILILGAITKELWQQKDFSGMLNRYHIIADDECFDWKKRTIEIAEESEDDDGLKNDKKGGRK